VFILALARRPSPKARDRFTEGTVTKVDRQRKEITVRFPHGKTEPLRLTERAAVDSGNHFNDGAVAPPRHRLSCTTRMNGGGKVVHYFRKVESQSASTDSGNEAPPRVR
jgi:hypothetical protein